MTEPPVRPGLLAATSVQILRDLQLIFANRVELLLMEVKEEQPRLLQALVLGVAAGVGLLMAVLCLTALIVVLGWDYSPLLTLIIITVLYLAAGLLACRKLIALFENWHPLPATRDQLARDREGNRQMEKGNP